MSLSAAGPRIAVVDERVEDRQAKEGTGTTNNKAILQNRLMRTMIAGATLGTMLVASVAAAPNPAKAPGRRTLATRGPVLALSADGDRAAFDVGLSGDCATLSVWAPTRGQVVRLRPRSRCDGIHRNTHALALAGTRRPGCGRRAGTSSKRSSSVRRSRPGSRSIWPRVFLTTSEAFRVASPALRSATARCSSSRSSGAAVSSKTPSTHARQAGRRATSSPRPSGGSAVVAPVRARARGQCVDVHASRTLMEN
jgi:hypothetical protein